MKILHEETIGGVRYMLRENGGVCTDGMVWNILYPDGSRVSLPFKDEVFEAAESFRARNWDRLRPLAGNEQRLPNGQIRRWEWRDDEFGSQVDCDHLFNSLSSWRGLEDQVSREIFTFGLARACCTCPPHLAVLDDGTIYRMADDEMRNLNHDVVPCSTWDSIDLDSYKPGFAPGQRERVEAWRARQGKGGGTVETRTIFGADDFSAELGEARLRIRELEKELDIAKATAEAERDAAVTIGSERDAARTRVRELEEKLAKSEKRALAGADFYRAIWAAVDEPRGDGESEEEYDQRIIDTVRGMRNERDAALARAKELEAKFAEPSSPLAESGTKFLADGSFSFEIDGTAYYRADHPRVLRGDEFRVRGYLAKIEEIGVNHDGDPVVTDNRGREWCPWVVPLIQHPDTDFLRAFWLANYQFADGEYLDEEAGVVRRRVPDERIPLTQEDLQALTWSECDDEPEAKKPEPFFTDSDGDVWEFVKSGKGWVAVYAGPTGETQAVGTFTRSGAPAGEAADALRAYVASAGERES